MTRFGLNLSLCVTHAVVLGLAPATSAWAVQQTVPQSSREQVLQSVNGALATAARGDFLAARSSLELSLATCGGGAEYRDCRVLYASGLGSLLLRQAAATPESRDTLYRQAIGYYDRILQEIPNESEALYGKALAYRGLGPQESMESFFVQAPTLDPSRSALYLTFKGDYYATAGRWTEAADAYRAAIQHDADDDGARSGLIDALEALGVSSKPELLRLARDWELRYSSSSADAYRTVLTLSFAPGATRDSVADAAMVGLVRLQSRDRLAVGAVPGRVSATWTPVREIRGFLATASTQTAPWWRESAERTNALAQAALAGGRAASGTPNYELAEKLWREGVGFAPRLTAISLDLQRQLALLYSSQKSLDPEGKKFDALEQDIFSEKMGALAVGDLEAAQRYHTTLGLIYLERGVWRGQQGARGAEQQFTWALDKADERNQRQGFYQPLPEIRMLLAHHFDSVGGKSLAARRYSEAARAFLDLDDLENADSAMRRAAALGGQTTDAMRALELRSPLARGDAGACGAQSVSSLSGGDRAFALRQRFKVLADCAKVDARRAQAHAIQAFTLVDSAHVALVGGGDVARFERVMATLLGAFGMAFRPEHLDPFAAPNAAQAIRVSLPGETVPFAYTAQSDDVLGARIAAALRDVRPFPMEVAGGVVSIVPPARPSPEVLARIQQVVGVKAVKYGAAASR
jgi:tetratricopeptide (TPR) repeat protein